MKRQIDTLTPDHDLLVAKARLHWQLMGERRKAISAIELCIRSLIGLRPTLGRAAVDPLVRDYRSALRFFASIGADAMPRRDQLDDYQRRMNELHQRLADLKEPLDYNQRSTHIVSASRRESAPQPLPTFKGK
jgi:hypothetical protein